MPALCLVWPSLNTTVVHTAEEGKGFDSAGDSTKCRARGQRLTSTELGCRDRAALAVDSTVPSAAVTEGTACVPPGMNAAAG